MKQNLILKNKLTKNQTLVLNVLLKAGLPLSAYSILEKLRKHGFKAPLQVYRALEKLIDTGQVHRIESKNAFIACEHSLCEISQMTAFTICQRCEKVSEVMDEELSNYVNLRAEKLGISMTKTNIEFHGLCDRCLSA